MAKTYNSIPTVSTGDVYTATAHNNIVTNVNNYRVPPMCRAKITGTVTVNDATNTIVALGAEDYDTDGMHDNSTNNSRVTFQTAGVYLVSGVINYTTGIDADHAPAILKNGTTEMARTAGAAGSHNGAACITFMAEFAVGDYVELQAYQNNSANTSRTLASNTSLQALWLGQVS